MDNNIHPIFQDILNSHVSPKKEESTGCSSCEVLYVNGVKTHEIGCPEAHKDELRECKWCGGFFNPEERNQDFCSPECGGAYYA